LVVIRAAVGLGVVAITLCLRLVLGSLRLVSLRLVIDKR
jgi:hypothetical protein